MLIKLHFCANLRGTGSYLGPFQPMITKDNATVNINKEATYYRIIIDSLSPHKAYYSVTSL
jgi:regulator of protease activity HflC (stomatin/prohibitin superfamily)